MIAAPASVITMSFRPKSTPTRIFSINSVSASHNSTGKQTTITKDAKMIRTALRSTTSLASSSSSVFYRATPLLAARSILPQSAPTFVPGQVAKRSYHQKVIDHYENPRNVGNMNKSDQDVGTGLVGAPACGE